MYNKRELFTFCFIIICLTMQVIVFAYIIFYNTAYISTMRLERVVLVSRHNVRTSLKNLQNITPHSWPKWKEDPGFLTEKGFKLEGYMGEYFSSWLSKEGLKPTNCPTEEDFYAYANYVQRTMRSAEAFVDKCFPNCKIKVHHSDTNSDSIFNPFVRNSSETFRKQVLKEMNDVLDHLNLQISYEDLESILDYKDSNVCKLNNDCDLNKDKNSIRIVAGLKPAVLGPLKVSHEAIDTFLMEYYNGFDLKDVAWGQLNETNYWNSLLNICKGYYNVTYKTPTLNKDMSKPMINYLKDVFLDKSTKITLIMGHDVNINVILGGMSFKPYFLKDSFIPVPIGGKLVFEKWFDRSMNKYLLRIRYIYQSTEQLREGLALSLDSPPQHVVMELEGCATDNQGFCLWDDFVLFLNEL